VGHFPHPDGVIHVSHLAPWATSRTQTMSYTSRTRTMAFVTDMIARMPWRTRLNILALFVGVACGIVCAAYVVVLDAAVEAVWREHGKQLFLDTLGHFLPNWVYIPLVTTMLGSLTGVLIHLLGEPAANLPGVVKEIYETGKIDYSDAPRMSIVSLVSIVGAGSLGPEAALIGIGGGLASLVASVVELSQAETLFITMCGMSSGLSAFFGEPVGGAIFACEVIHRWGAEYYEAFIPTVISGVACNFVFRWLLSLPQEAIWHFEDSDAGVPNTVTTLWGIPMGVIGGALGYLWIKSVLFIRTHIFERFKIGKSHVLKGVVGGLLIGIIGAVFPETLFWAEAETQTVIDAGVTPLPHVWPTVGALGAYSLSDPRYLIAIGLLKLVAIGVSVLAGYRGGFIFPFMMAGNSLGSAFSRISLIVLGSTVHDHTGLHLAAAALGCAAAINTAVTRTVLATPIVLITLSARPDVFPSVLIASVISLYITGDVAIITAGRKRLRREQLGADKLTDCWTDRADKAVALWKKSGSGIFSKALTTSTGAPAASTAWLEQHLEALKAAHGVGGAALDEIICAVSRQLDLAHAPTAAKREPSPPSADPSTPQTETPKVSLSERLKVFRSAETML